ncbi:DUF1684 domain-containing protein [Rathayibacter sp. VKM Ac-2803]|uniref:DUF1684 domain-containing protein n=1 Tax=Rathayibacter sp. VKM Ac-2803 TaxID=2609256 RepID=UPI00135B3289|nr:DUF1684 domain-containing protein [Rathayibacter sp. VKM Ac-2803]MWV49472.1 DUF1684 domain-containing protein [Rathayibacter sp. VKM Ac-2803]
MSSTSSITAPSRASMDLTESARAGWEAWLMRRAARVTGPRGDLALVETRWLAAGESVDDEAALAGHGPTATLTRMRRPSLETGEEEYGYRVWDAASEAIRAFDTIETFPFDAAWVLEAWFEPVDEERTIPFEHLRDNGATRDLVVPGDITFSLVDDGRAREYTVAAFDDGGSLLVPFGDPTNRSDDPELSSYPVGRFLVVQRLDGAADAGTPGPVLLDFNRAYIPPCGFSPHYNCPLPPAQNRLAVPVTAGERRVRTAAAA